MRLELLVYWVLAAGRHALGRQQADPLPPANLRLLAVGVSSGRDDNEARDAED